MVTPKILLIALGVIIVVFLGILVGLIINDGQKHPKWGSETYQIYSSPPNGVNESPRITLVTLTSPSRFDPSMEHISKSIRSLRRWKGLENAPSIIVADAIKPKTKYSKTKYAAYLAKLKEKVLRGEAPFHATTLLLANQWTGPNQNIGKAVSLVGTSYLYSNQHDLVFDGEKMSKLISFDDFAKHMEQDPSLDYIVFRRQNVHPSVVEGWFEPTSSPAPSLLPIKRAYGWSDADHVAKTSYWKIKMMPWLPTNPKLFPEDHLHPTIKACRKDETCLGSKLHGAGQNLYVWDEPMVVHLDGQSKL